MRMTMEIITLLRFSEPSRPPTAHHSLPVLLHAIRDSRLLLPERLVGRIMVLLLGIGLCDVRIAGAIYI